MREATVRNPPRPRVVIAGLGDSGLLTAIHLTRHCDVVGISNKPGLVSGKELGTRLTRPQYWVQDYWISFDRYRRLDSARTIHGTVTGVDLDERSVHVAAADGTTSEEPYDVLVISTGVTSGFWRPPGLLSSDDVAADLEKQHRRLADAASIAVVGGGASAVGSAVNLAVTWPEKQVDLYFPGERALTHHHPNVWKTLRGRVTDLGVGSPPGSSRRGTGRIRRRPDHRRPDRVEHRSGPGDRRRRAVDDRQGAAEHRLAPRGPARR